MSDLDHAYKRHRVLRQAAENENARALADLTGTRNIALGLVEVGETESSAKEKVAVFFEVLGHRVDELGFLDVFFTFERELDTARKSAPERAVRRGHRPPTVKGLSQYLHRIDDELANDFRVLIQERNRLAHGKLSSSQGPIVPVDWEKQILERVLSGIVSPLSQA